MRAGLAIAATLLAAGCVTPVQPDSSVDLTGDWRITAVSGVATPTQTAGFNFRYSPPAGSAQFGCNWGSGNATVQNGWLTTGDWIITAAGCGEERERFERQGFEILGKPLAIQAAGPDRVRLSNERGSLTLVRHSVPQLAGTHWRVVSVNGQPGGGRIFFSPSDYHGSFGCNAISGEYRQEGDRFLPSVSRMTEKGCLGPAAPGPVPLITYEQWGANVLWGGGVTISAAGEGRIRLQNPKGVILLERVAAY
jgi:heat shock protein HslJ